MVLVPVGCWVCPSSPDITMEELTSSLYRGSKVNQRATAHRCPLVTAFTPWGFSPPEEKLIILPHLGLMEACRETAQSVWRGAARLHTGEPVAGLSMLQTLGPHWASLCITPGPGELLSGTCTALGTAEEMCGVNRDV